MVPKKDGFWKKDYVTYRRLWLDACLSAFSNEMRGTVLDIGGKREKKRGSFQPPENQARTWWYINLDWGTNPNIFADVTQTPLEDQSIDCILCTEVLEHLPDPQAGVDEVHRLLRNDGVALFLYHFSTLFMQTLMTFSGLPKTVYVNFFGNSNPLRYIGWVGMRGLWD
ncbi:MAG: methyltransferase domain-containing protein [Anaerolineales bacterium]|nr:methyltransferase domain-containing protein [Anaerolineales bacterium]